MVGGHHGDDLVMGDGESFEANGRVGPLDEADLAAVLPNRVDDPWELTISSCG
jgi:hypothetical protein